MHVEGEDLIVELAHLAGMFADQGVKDVLERPRRVALAPEHDGARQAELESPVRLEGDAAHPEPWVPDAVPVPDAGEGSLDTNRAEAPQRAGEGERIERLETDGIEGFDPCEHDPAAGARAEAHAPSSDPGRDVAPGGKDLDASDVEVLVVVLRGDLEREARMGRQAERPAGEGSGDVVRRDRSSPIVFVVVADPGQDPPFPERVAGIERPGEPAGRAVAGLFFGPRRRSEFFVEPVEIVPREGGIGRRLDRGAFGRGPEDAPDFVNRERTLAPAETVGGEPEGGEALGSGERPVIRVEMRRHRPAGV